MTARCSALPMLLVVACGVASTAPFASADEPDRTRRGLTRPRENAPPPPPPAAQQPNDQPPPRAPAANPPTFGPPAGAPSGVDARAGRSGIRSRASARDYTANPFPNARENFGPPDQTRSGLVRPDAGRDRSGWRSRRDRGGEWNGRRDPDGSAHWPGEDAFDHSAPGPGWRSRYDRAPVFVDGPRYADLPTFSPSTGAWYTDPSGAGLNWTFDAGDNIRGVGVIPQAPRSYLRDYPSSAAGYASGFGWPQRVGPRWGYGYTEWSGAPVGGIDDWRWRGWYDDRPIRDRSWRSYGAGEDGWARLRRGEFLAGPQSFFHVYPSPDVFNDDGPLDGAGVPPAPEMIANEAQREKERSDALRMARTNPRYNVVPDFTFSVDAVAQNEFSLAVGSMRRAALVNPAALVRPDGDLARSLRSDPELMQRARYAMGVFQSPPSRVVSDADARFMVAALAAAMGDNDVARGAIREALGAGDAQTSTALLRDVLDDPSVTAPNPWTDGAPLKK